MILGAALGVILSASQLHWATVAYQIGAPYGEGRTLVALEGQESSYCQFTRNRWSVGCLGTKRATVRAIYDSSATRARLESDKAYSIRAGLGVFLYCKAHAKTWRAAVACYHYGLPVSSKMSDAQIDADGYIKAIQRRMKEIRVDTR